MQKLILIVSGDFNSRNDIDTFKPFDEKTLLEIFSEAIERTGSRLGNQTLQKIDIDLEPYPYYFGSSSDHFVEEMEVVLDSNTDIAFIDCNAFNYNEHGFMSLHALNMIGLFGRGSRFANKKRYIINNSAKKEYKGLIPPTNAMVNDDIELICALVFEMQDKPTKEILSKAS